MSLPTSTSCTGQLVAGRHGLTFAAFCIEKALENWLPHNPQPGLATGKPRDNHDRDAKKLPQDTQPHASELSSTERNPPSHSQEGLMEA